jgi:signal transduction histidine kinase
MTGAESGAARAPYRGEDRRLSSLPAASPRVPFAVGAVVLLALWAAGLLFGEAQDGVAPATAALSTTVAALAVALGTLCIARWLVAGEAPALLLGLGSLCYGVLVVGVVELFPLFGAWTPGAAEIIGRLRPAAVLVALGLFGLGALVRPIDTRVRGGIVLAAALGGLALLAALGPQLQAVGDRAPSVLLVGAGALAVVHGVRGWQRREWLSASFALLLAAIALVRLAGVPDSGMPTPWAQALRLTGLGFALYGALRQLLLGYRDQSASLLRTRVSLATAQDRVRASQERAEELAHEARSALAAIEGATITLQRYTDRLPAETRTQLTMAVRGEIRRLQRLVTPAAEEVATFEVAELLAPIVAAERARGTAISSLVPADLRARGLREAAGDALRTVLDNARRYAPGPVTIRAAEESGRVVIRVEDRGPGVRPDQRGAIFARGTRGEASHGTAGSGLGLFVAAEALAAGDGQLWVDDRAGGGASFALSLPAAPAASPVSGGGGREVTADQVEHGDGRVQEHPPPAPGPGHRAQPGVGGAGQADDDRRRDALG